ncbi:response regulator [Xanthocytophaga flava]|uniref:response regulator n=1 Tax=Xanthocytophaga flava TaxID=3048013 RepID=UPI0028D89CF7|nr:response regulator [Xanthocytophaga flavus]MDJ1470181.1 response regulator [Xanthocytophaga flavus]
MKKNSFFLLAADDDQDDRDILQMVLDQSFPDWKYSIASNGQLLLDYLQAHLSDPPFVSVILLDINMPLRNGIDIVRELRTNPAYEQIPVVAFSTAGDKRIIDQFLEAGGDTYFQKPFNIEDIYTILAQLPEISKQKNSSAAGSAL